jgi:hypothetical protein
MASGQVTDSCSNTAQVSSNSCADVRAGLDAYLSTRGFSSVSCSADPVAVGTSLGYLHTSGFQASCSVTSITATASPLLQFDKKTAGEFFGFGFGIVIFFYLLGLKGSVLLRYFWRN